MTSTPRQHVQKITWLSSSHSDGGPPKKLQDTVDHREFSSLWQKASITELTTTVNLLFPPPACSRWPVKAITFTTKDTGARDKIWNLQMQNLNQALHLLGHNCPVPCAMFCLSLKGASQTTGMYHGLSSWRSWTPVLVEEDAEEPVSFNYLILSLALQHICSLEVFHGEKNLSRTPASVHRSFGFTHIQNCLINRVNHLVTRLLGSLYCWAILQYPYSHWPCSSGQRRWKQR